MSQIVKALQAIQIALIIGTFLFFSWAWYQLNANINASEMKLELLMKHRQEDLDSHQKSHQGIEEIKRMLKKG